MGEIVTMEKAVQQLTNWRQLSPADALEKKSKNEISLYGQGTVTDKCLADCIIQLKKAFPKIGQGFYDVLESMLDAEGFTDQRLIDATAALIKTCEFPEPTIARIIGFDRSVKVHTYNELLNESNNLGPQARAEFLESFGRINYYGELRFVKKEIIKKFNLPAWENKN